jgi:DNA-binding CsgD family transcriptional regulator
MLEGLGLTADEEAAYLAMLAEPPLGRARLVTLLGWSRARLAKTLTALIEDGLVTTLIGRPARYAAIAPDVAFDGLHQRRIDGARRAQQLVPALMDRFWAARDDTTAVDFIEIISGDTETILHRVSQLHDSVTTRIRGLDRPPYPRDPIESSHVEVSGLNKGIAYQVVYDRIVVEEPSRWADLEVGIVAGEQARVLEGLPTRLTLFDDRAATLPVLTPAGGYAATIVVHRSPLLDALTALFDSCWTRAVPLTIDPAGHPRGTAETAAVPHRAERLVQLMAAGLTDDAIRRALKVSPSTVQRGIRDLMDRLGVRTRFQLGLQIGRDWSAAGRDGA